MPKENGKVVLGKLQKKDARRLVPLPVTCFHIVRVRGLTYVSEYTSRMSLIIECNGTTCVYSSPADVFTLYSYILHHHLHRMTRDRITSCLPVNTDEYIAILRFDVLGIEAR